MYSIALMVTVRFGCMCLMSQIPNNVTVVAVVVTDWYSIGNVIRLTMLAITSVSSFCFFIFRFQVRVYPFVYCLAWWRCWLSCKNFFCFRCDVVNSFGCSFLKLYRKCFGSVRKIVSAFFTADIRLTDFAIKTKLFPGITMNGHAHIAFHHYLRFTVSYAIWTVAISYSCCFVCHYIKNW